MKNQKTLNQFAGNILPFPAPQSGSHHAPPRGADTPANPRETPPNFLPDFIDAADGVALCATDCDNELLQLPTAVDRRYSLTCRIRHQACTLADLNWSCIRKFALSNELDGWIVIDQATGSEIELAEIAHAFAGEERNS